MKLDVLINKINNKIVPGLKYLPQSKFRICNCCLQKSIFLSFSEGEEIKLCVRCRANLRYEMLAQTIRESFNELSRLDVIEFDDNSPLFHILSGAKTYMRTYYSKKNILGSVRADGVYCQDITQLTLQENSVDLMISSDVLEHVSDLHLAFKETSRVLRPGGIHYFTVPLRANTKPRAEIIDGSLKYYAAPEYHSDPLDPAGILVYWDIGLDAPHYFSLPDLTLSIVKGPEGKDRRIVWKAEKH